ncbi:MAG: ABC transporter permease [Anaerolineaceae bacterium]
MKIVKLLPQVASSLTANKLRTGLTMLGIIIGVAAVIAMLAIGNGAKQSIVSSIESAGTNLIFITSYSEGGARNLTPLTLADSEAIASPGAAPSVAAVAPSVSASYTVTYLDESTTATIYGVTSDYATVRKTSVTQGSFITQEQVDNRSTVAVIGVGIADDLFNTRENLLGNKIRIDDMIYTIIGVLKEAGGSSFGSEDNQIFIPLTTAQSRLVSRSSVKNAVSTISVSALSTDTVDAAISEITTILRTRHKITGDTNDFRVLSQESMAEMASSITGVLTLFLGGIGGISLLVGGIGIMNIMLVSVIERTREIGLRKAVGARKRDILSQFLIESLIIGVAGGLMGILLGSLISFLIGRIASASGTSLNPVVSLGSILLATLFSIAVGLIFGLYPANRAANLEPVEALRSE